MKAAGLLFLTTDRKALFLRRSASAPDCPGCWDFPGGGQEGDESAEECALREAKEEVGKFPTGKPRYHVRQKVSPGGRGVGVLALPQQGPPLVPQPPTPIAQDVDFTTFIMDVKDEFQPDLNDEHDGFAWAPVGAPPEPLHPGCRIALDRLTMDELGVARAIAEGRLTSPQVYENVWLWAIRITGTDVAFRSLHEEFVLRKPELYVDSPPFVMPGGHTIPEFLARCNGLAVIFKHPKKHLLTSQEFGDRVVGTIFLPYIAGSEVWGIAKVYDDATNRAMEKEQLSTSPGVNFADFSVNARLRLEDGSKVLVEGKPSLLDHVAICELGVWDKGGEAAGVRSETSRGDAMPKTAEEIAAEDKAKKDAEDKARKDAEEKMTAEEKAEADKKRKDAEEEEKKKADAEGGKGLEKMLGNIKDSVDSMHKRMDAFEEKEKEKEKTDKARRDAEEKEKREKGDPEQLAADKAKKDAEEKEAKEKAEKDRKDAEAKAATDAADTKKRIEEVAAMVRPLPDDDHHALADAYSRADDVFSAFGKDTPRPIPGETSAQYRRRVTKLLKDHSPTWSKVDLSSTAFTDEAAFGIAEGQIMDEAKRAAMSPTTVKPGQLRMVERRRDGHIVREFVGEPRAWMDPLAGATQLRGVGSWARPDGTPPSA